MIHYLRVGWDGFQQEDGGGGVSLSVLLCTSLKRKIATHFQRNLLYKGELYACMFSQTEMGERKRYYTWLLTKWPRSLKFNIIFQVCTFPLSVMDISCRTARPATGIALCTPQFASWTFSFTYSFFDIFFWKIKRKRNRRTLVEHKH